MSESDQRIDYLRALFDRYLALPRQQTGVSFKTELKNLQLWEIEDIRRRHATKCHDDAHYAAVLNFYIEELHNGLALQGMIDRGPQGIENARKLDKAYQLFANAIEFSVISAEVQDQLAIKMGDTAITVQHYAAAVLACDDLPLRQRRLDLLVEIGHEVAPHLGSRLIQTGFKLLKGIFRSSGLIDIHNAGDKGFSQLRKVPRLAQTLALFAETEKNHLNSLSAN